MTKADKPDDDPLEAAFRAARAEARRAPPPGLMARIEADAARQQRRTAPAAAFAAAAPAVLAARAAPAPLGARLRAVMTALGGWPALGGLTAAAASGLWLGLAPPTSIEDAGGWLGGDAGLGTASLLPDDYLALSGEG